MALPLCFVLMPFGRKPGAGGAIIDFDAVYQELIAPAITAAGMEPIRADQELTGGIIHKPMFERLILCEYAVADLTTANANVFYELGLRHTVRPSSTQLIFAEGTGQLPFDVALLRALPYKLGPDGKPANAGADSEWQSALNGTAPAVDMIPRNIIMCPWHYEYRKSYPSIPMFLAKGFRVLPASYEDTSAVKSLIAYSYDFAENEKMLGHLFTTWSVHTIGSLLCFNAIKVGMKTLQAVESEIK